MLNFRKHYGPWRRGAAPIAPRDWANAIASSHYAQHLTKNDRAKLHQLTLRFLAIKTFSGSHDLVVTAAMRTRIAVHACLPILNLGLDYYRNWRGVVVYPGDFRVRHTYEDEAGVVHEGMEDLCGESLSGGPVVLSWEAMQRESEAQDLDLVVHECAHTIDALNGDGNGFPPLHRGMSAAAWSHDWHSAFDDLCRRLDVGEETRIDPYAARTPAEFFAVMTETFFTSPHWIGADYPGVYSQLAAFYRQDTAALLRKE